MNTDNRKGVGTNLCVSIQRLIQWLMSRAHSRILTRRLDGLVTLADECTRSGVPEGDRAFKTLYGQAQALCKDYAAQRGMSEESLLFAMPAMSRLQRSAQPASSKKFGIVIAITLAIPCVAVLIGLCSGLLVATFHLIAGGR